MVEAFLLIQCDMGSGASVTDQVRTIPGVKLVDYVTGPYDLIARAEATDLAALGKIVDEVQVVPGVTRTMTCPILPM